MMNDMTTRRGRAAAVLGLAALAALGILSEPSHYQSWSSRPSRVTTLARSARNEPKQGSHPPDDPHLIAEAVSEPSQQDAAAPTFVLDFAIVGYPKTATSFVLGWLAEHEQVLASTSEMYELQQGRVDEFVVAMSRLNPKPSNGTVPIQPHLYRRGYKAPRDIQNSVVMKTLRDHWPETRLIVGLRHPVLWFESFYNYRARHGFALPPPSSSEFLRQPTCTPARTHGVCVNDARFHVPLATLGMTPLTSSHELHLLQMDDSEVADLIGLHRRRRSRHKIFLYEMSQVYESTQPSHDPNATEVERRAERFRRDLASFLGLTTPLSDSYSEPGHYLPNRTQALRICDNQHSELRRRLMENARAASTWIREYMLVRSNEGDVVVSSPLHFDALLRTWMIDPCRRVDPNNQSKM